MNPRPLPEKGQPPRQRLRRGYTLVEVLAAAAIFAVGTAAACSLASSLLLQEELAWRTAITRNYQENMLRLWQLGMGDLTSRDATTVAAVMPSPTHSPRLNEALFAVPILIATGTTTVPDLGKMEACTCSASVNISSDPAAKVQGASLSLNAYRASLRSDLRKLP